MKKRLLPLLLAAILLTTPCLAASVEIAAPSAILIDRTTGTVLYEENADQALPPASVTKIMTLLLVVEAIDAGRVSWDDTVTASAAAAGKGGSQVYLEEGEQMSLREMVKCVVVSSANDCATALAEHVAGSESAFVELMNQRAAELGMTNTHFVNCTGLDDGADAAQHLTTARDISLMSRELLGHEEIKEFTTIWMDTVRNGQFGLSNTNKLIRFYDGATGLKTGYTSAAGYCLSASAERDGMELVAVVLHCASSTDRFESAKALLDYGFANYCLVTPTLEADTGTVAVTLGQANTITPVLGDTSPLLLDKGLKSAVTQEVQLVPTVSAPVEAGQTLGTLTLAANGETLAEIPLVAPDDVERLTFGDVFLRLLRGMCLGGTA
jgi:D-alanyl-D-alanine carboxypeptidase (penicillin-binding protein 5/6)